MGGQFRVKLEGVAVETSPGHLPSTLKAGLRCLGRSGVRALVVPHSPKPGQKALGSQGQGVRNMDHGI